MGKQRLVVIGNGMAGVHCLEEIFKLQPDRFDVTIFGSEPHFNYNRILLSSVLQGSAKIRDITLNDRNWYEKNRIQLYTSETVTEIDHQQKCIRTNQNKEVQYDKVIIATGSTPFILPVPGAEKEGVHTFRTIEDCTQMMESAKRYKKAVVIGGGVLGLEAARGLLGLGMAVDVVHLSNSLMDKQLDSTASKMLRHELEQQGMNFLLEKETAEIMGERRVEGIRFKDGTKAAADVVVMAAGVRPNIQLAIKAGIETRRAIKVNDYLQTSAPDIYAVGECAEHRNKVYGLVKPLYEQGKELAKHICEVDSHGYQGSTLSTKLKISGVEVFSAGNWGEDDTTKTMIHYDEDESIYKKIVLRDDRVKGAIMFGDATASNRLIDYIYKKKAITAKEKKLLMQEGSPENSEISTMESAAIVCNCNGVSKGEIIEVAQKQALTTIEEVKKCTKASGACGGCKSLVGDLLTYMQSAEFKEVKEERSLCSCTSLTDEEVVTNMQTLQLVSFEEVTSRLGWSNKEGCSLCAAAIDYYIKMLNPSHKQAEASFELFDHPYAVRQHDGSYIVSPHMYGGFTDAKQLRKLADLMEKYRIRQAFITEEQRLSLLGVSEEALCAIDNETDLSLMRKDANIVQVMNECMGDENCLCDKQEVFKLGEKMDQMITHINTPHRIKVRVSGCIHTKKRIELGDIGVVHSNLGWEIYVGGMQKDMKAVQLLYVANSDHELLEIFISLIEYYRQTARYSEQLFEWLERMNLLHVREILLDNELRDELNENSELETGVRV
ncbi:NasB nitrate/nitrite reduction [Alkalihalophilus pseudofirmus OF4]|uniref:NasB nitrate/nitrite reduction n=1 Tax=Alkalihalophilus pseudofirmus (strain ATCC BAA-2126 / JCM 17055 / OF4) TaxID=398511 RepID=D3FYD4_ALKPO|nr:nitrite reductase large subunit NirB [Alkalihalophilus pseudofirmus]ADC49157.1 NasB nitrate/nitrite reduction [Alkalihalophilus pseudofirmus OF4]